MEQDESLHPLDIGMLCPKTVMLVSDTFADLIKELYRRGRRNAAFLSGYCHVRILPSLKIKGVENAERDYMAV
jgi:hypothetical protein